MPTRTRRYREVPFDEWSCGIGGHILACVDCFWLVTAGEPNAYGRRNDVPVYKTEAWADAHAERFDHQIEPVGWFRQETDRLLQEAE